MLYIGKTNICTRGDNEATKIKKYKVKILFLMVRADFDKEKSLKQKDFGERKIFRFKSKALCAILENGKIDHSVQQ